MRVVCENTPDEITAKRLQDVLEAATRRLTANLLRIAAGAGSPSDVFNQALDLVTALDSLRDFSGSAFPHPPWVPIIAALRDRDWRRGNPGYPSYDHARAEQERQENAMERAKDAATEAALRLVAAQLLAQPTQESTSSRALGRALMDYENARKAWRP